MIARYLSFCDLCESFKIILHIMLSPFLEGANRIALDIVRFALPFISFWFDVLCHCVTGCFTGS